MKKNFLISTGGSGGHVVPATILCNHLAKKNNIIISIDKRGLNYLEKDFYNVEIINTPKLNNIFFLPFNVFLIFFLTVKSFFLLRKKEIKKIFSTGGYMSLPLILAAKLLRLDLYLIEPNQVLGRANKYFLNTCKKIFCYTREIKNFPENYKKKIVLINPLVKENIYKLQPLPFQKKKFTILIVGGSQGAKIFDSYLKDKILNLSKKFSINIIHQTSKKNISYLENFYTKNRIENKIFSFDKNFASIMQQSDLCITRAGASTLAELSVLNIPFIAVPLPTSRDNHQFENAYFYKKNDCCWLIEQMYFKEKIGEVLEAIFEKKSDYLKKKENLKKLNYQNTWIGVNQKILGAIDEN